MELKDAVNTILPGKYRCYMGGEIEVLYVAKHWETGDPMGVYRKLNGDDEILVRPAEAWSETVEHEGSTVQHFTRIVSVDHNWDDA